MTQLHKASTTTYIALHTIYNNGLNAMRAVHGSLLKTLFSLTKSLVKEGKASGSKNPYIYSRNVKVRKLII